MTNRHFAILEAPSVLGLFPRGVETLPQALLAAGLAERLGASYNGRVDPPPYNAEPDPETLLLNPHGIADYSVALADAVGSLLDKNTFAVVLGGDCSILLGTVVQLLLPLPWLRRTGFGLTREFNWRDERVMRVLKLMLPVTLGIGLINFNLSVNSIFATLISEEAPAAIDKAFRIYMLPQGMFAVARNRGETESQVRFQFQVEFRDGCLIHQNISQWCGIGVVRRGNHRFIIRLVHR